MWFLCKNTFLSHIFGNLLPEFLEALANKALDGLLPLSC